MSSEAIIRSKDYFEDIPIWTPCPTQARFEVMADKVSGRIPVTRLESWRNFEELIENPFFNQPNAHYVFRGHRRYDWGLTPSLGRVSENGIISKALAEDQLTKFRRAIRGRIDDRTMLDSDKDERQCDELWAVGQHHGLMTPLLDWSYSPYVALFFAFAKADAKGEKDNPYRVVYLLLKNFVSDDDRGSKIRVFEPRKDDHGRLVNQAGLFTFSPYDSTIENTLGDILSDPEFDDDDLRNAAENKQPEILARYISKIYIRNDDRDGCLRHLRRMNVHHASLFPDILGAADYCNIITEEEAKGRLIQKSSALTSPPPKVAVSAPTEQPPTPAIAGTIPADFEGILRAPDAASQVESGRIGAISSELSLAFAKEKAVDWKDRESIQARLRVVAKVILRKFGYPVGVRESVAENLVNHMINQG